jgi:hypothetical protein
VGICAWSPNVLSPPKDVSPKPSTWDEANPMSFYKGTFLAIFTCLATYSRAQDCLSNLPQSVRSAVEQENWRIVQPQDLSGNDPQVFRVNHPGECPGVTVGNFYPKGKSSYLVATIQRDDQKNPTEKLTLVFFKKDLPVTAVVVPPTQVADPFVVWKLRPGHYQDLYGTKATISRESFVYEKLVGPAKQFYYDGTHLKSFVISR